MKKVLFTGATGLLGKYFFKTPHPKFEIFGTYNNNSNLKKKFFYPLNVSNEKEVHSLIQKIKPDYVIHAAAIGNVDYCETHRDEAEMVNIRGTGYVADAARNIGATMFFTSSNAIFDGENPPYLENSITNPLDYYGKTKVDGEKIIKKNGVNFVILRLMTMYGWPPIGGRNNPVGWVVDELRNEKKINVVNDIFNNHLYAQQAVDIIWDLIKKRIINETYNIAGGESVSRFELALMTAKVFGLDKSLINSVSSDFFTNIVPRPKNTTFKTSKIEKDLGINPLNIIEGLRKMKDEK